MKLISKTLLYYLLISLPLLVIAGFFSYHLISIELKDGLDEALIKEKIHLEKAITKMADPLRLNVNELTNVSPAKKGLVGETFADSVMYDSLEQENVTYRILNSYFEYNDQNYNIRIAKPTMEEEELMEGLFSSFAILGFFLLISFFIVNWIISKTLWRPFYKTLEQLNAYQLKEHIPENFERSSTKEFNRLNHTLNKMTNKIHEDFLQQKEFTENASHEMQTPLAVIKANISLLMQSDLIQSTEMSQIQAIDDTAKKLASLNKALLLLAKIENYQFKEIASIEIGSLVNKVVLHFEDLLEAKEIKIVNHMKDPVFVNMNPTLAEVLITNLFQNAIRHNFKGGLINLDTNKNEFIISNTGSALTISEEELFLRFKKNESSKDSLGLGLAIVKSICVLYHITIKYAYANEMHNFILEFNKTNN